MQLEKWLKAIRQPPVSWFRIPDQGTRIHFKGYILKATPTLNNAATMLPVPRKNKNKWRSLTDLIKIKTSIANTILEMSTDKAIKCIFSNPWNSQGIMNDWPATNKNP